MSSIDDNSRWKAKGSGEEYIQVTKMGPTELFSRGFSLLALMLAAYSKDCSPLWFLTIPRHRKQPADLNQCQQSHLKVKPFLGPSSRAVLQNRGVQAAELCQSAFPYIPLSWLQSSPGFFLSPFWISAKMPSALSECQKHKQWPFFQQFLHVLLSSNYMSGACIQQRTGWAN